MDEAITMGVKAIQKGSKKKINPEAIDIRVINAERNFQKLSSEESRNYVEKHA